MAAAEPEHVPPVFLMCNSLPAVEEKDYDVYELCKAAETVTGFATIEGAQRIGALWRLYPKTLNARVSLLTKGLVLRGHCVQTKDKNPFIVRDRDGEEREVPSVRLTIGNIPLSFSNDEIMNFINKVPGVKTRSRLMDERARDDNGKLSHYKTGRRFIHIETPNQPLPKVMNIGVFKASLYHPGQKQTTCSKCLASGHHVTACKGEVRCRQCLQYGHKQGDPQCHLAPPPPMPAEDTTSPQNREPTQDIEKTGKSQKQTSLDRLLTRRGRSTTPPRGKRLRSPSLQRSPRSAGSKNARGIDKRGQKAADHPESNSPAEQIANNSISNSGETIHDPPP